MKLNNKYYILRHGEALSNVKDIISSWPEKFKNPLTRDGREMVKKTAEELKDKNIDLIFSSDLLRTKETSVIVSQVLKIKPKFDKRLREINFGDFNAESAEKFLRFFNDRVERIKKGPPHGENYSDVAKRMVLFLKEINNKYKGKNILIVSHQAPLFLLEGYTKGLSLFETIEEFPKEIMLRRGQLRELN